MTAALLIAVSLALPGQRTDGPPPDTYKPDPALKALDKSGALFFDPRDRSLLIRARVCLREGYLEHLLCAERTKEHESILATKADPRAVKAGLILTGAEEGHPVRYQPKFEPPAGSSILIRVDWLDGDKTRTANARDWVKDGKTGKPIDKDWVFAGSQLFPDPERPGKTIFAADGGDLFTVANFTSAILDVPFASTGNDAERSFVANTDAIPARNSYVSLILRPSKPDGAKSKP